jgi:hypothetical protein
MPNLSNSTQVCALCGKNVGLIKSHIISEALSKRLQSKTDNTSLIKLTTKPYPIRTQTGPIMPLLCRDCDGRLFSQWENWFVTTIYDNLHQDNLDYDERLKKFIVSLQWRVVKWTITKDTSKKTAGIDQLLNRERAFLLRKTQDPQENNYLFFSTNIPEPALRNYVDNVIDFEVFPIGNYFAIFMVLAGIVIVSIPTVDNWIKHSEWNEKALIQNTGTLIPKNIGSADLATLSWLNRRMNRMVLHAKNYIIHAERKHLNLANERRQYQ